MSSESNRTYEVENSREFDPSISKPVIELLIVDDDSKVAESLINIFKHYGYQPIAVNSGGAAISLLKNLDVKLTLLDLNMPDIDGFDVLEYIAGNTINTHVIILSGENSFNAATQAMRYDFVYDFIRKPYLVKDLLPMVTRAQEIIKRKESLLVQHAELSQSEQIHRFLVEHSPHIVFLLNDDGKFTFLNNASSDVLGYTQQELQGKHYSELVFNDDFLKAEQFFNNRPKEALEVNSIALRLHNKIEDRFKIYEVTAKRIPFSESNRLNRNLKPSSQIIGAIKNTKITKPDTGDSTKLKLAMENNPNLIFITNQFGEIEYANRKITEVTGYPVEEVLGNNPRIFASGDTSTEEYQALWNCLNAGKIWRGVIKNRKKNGEIYWARESIAPMFDAYGAIINFVSIQEDVTEALKLAEQLSHEATHDSLTHLVNRQEFNRRLHRIVAPGSQENTTTHVLCYLDLDQFKIVNDTCNHAAGDELLRQICHQFTQIVRTRDTLARLGGDEFAILMEYCSLEQALGTTQRIHKMLEGYQFHWEGKTFRIGVSIGLVLINPGKDTAEHYLKQADSACYKAKAAGKNQTHIYRTDDGSLIQNSNTVDWRERINQAIATDVLCLYTQPIVALGVLEGDYCEILLRMKNGRDDLIMPMEFLPAAERYQLSSKIDRWVITNAFNYFAKTPERLNNLFLCSINLSGLSINDPDFVDFIETQLKITGMLGHKVCFEIAETVAIVNLTKTMQFMTRLKTFGCKFSLDDFGSGFSSFAYLKNLPIDFLKIDGDFVKSIEKNNIDLAMVKSINDIGHVLGKKTIAESVENQRILELLQELEVDYVQGHHLGEPTFIYAD